MTELSAARKGLPPRPILRNPRGGGRPTNRLYAARLTRTVLATLFNLLNVALAQAQVIPDGSTATTVATDPGTGASIVSISPVIADGLSRNSYSSFSVTSAGVDLDNRNVAARTILNEVTSSRISELNGPLTVLGARAHVIIANPNGINVDGARFTNTGGVVLSTGTPSIVSREIAPGFNQENARLDVHGGVIDVGPGGVSGAMTSLQLIAARIRVDGPVANDSAGTHADIRLQAGDSSVEYDSSILPISDLEDWGRLTENPSLGQGIAVEITSRGSLKANNIRIHATDQGAGVSHAGEGLASSGDFIISAKGEVTTTGSLKAARNLRVEADSIVSTSPVAGRQATIEAVDGALTLLASGGDILNSGVLMSGAVRDVEDPDSLGGVTLKATGNIELLSENADQLAIVFASADDLVIEAGGNVINDTGRVLSNAAIYITAAGDIENSTEIISANGAIGEWVHEVRFGKRLWYTLWLQRQRTEVVSLTYGNRRIEGQQAYIAGSSVRLEAGGAVTNLASSINANAGTLEIDAESILNEAVLAGRLSFTRTCGVFCTGHGSSDIALVGGYLNAASTLTLTAGSLIRGRGGQLNAYENMVLTAPQVILEALPVPTVYSRPAGLYNFWAGTSAWVGLPDGGGILFAPSGSIVIDAFEPVIVDAGTIDAGYGINIPNGTEFVAAPTYDLPFVTDRIGLLRRLIGQ